MSEQQAEFKGWARVEVMGHQTHIGFVRTEAYGAAVLFRVDTPGADEREYTLEEPSYCTFPVCESVTTSQWCPRGTIVKRKPRPPVTVLIGAGSIYRIIPCDEAAALVALEREQRTELILVRLPAGVALPSPEETGGPFDDHCDECGKTPEYCVCDGSEF